MSGSESLRRSTRIQSRAKEHGNSKHELTNKDEDSMSETRLMRKKELENIEESIQKPVELFSDNDVSGEKLYGFQTPSAKKNAMTRKASLCHTPVSIKKTEKLVLSVVLDKIQTKPDGSLKIDNKNSCVKTSTIQRRYLLEIPSSESESVSENSEYVLSNSDTESETSEKETSIDSSDEGHKIEKKNIRQKPVFQANLVGTPKKTSSRNKPAIIHKDFHIKTDEYFKTQSEKVTTSDRTLERLRNSRLTKESLGQLLTNHNYVSTQHKKIVLSLSENYANLYSMWDFIMEQGFTVLLYGVGSKRCLINTFHKSICYHPSLIVNGFFPSLTVKDILDGIITNLMRLSCPANMSECIDLIEKVLKENPNDRIYLLIHNIDGMMLRSNKAQDILSCLASIPNICVVASVDHVNAPLLWDHIKRSKFNFFWWDTTTFLPYREETSYEGSLLVQESGTLALSSLHNVFLSLTSNAKAVYLLLAKHQFNNPSNVNSDGMAFKDLYQAAREGFIVSSDLVLRAQLTEFIDHKLVKVKRNIDGVEHLVIPLSKGLLKQFLEEYDL
ncbi:origin recognition complex subunit 2 [Colletes gigas]|uniref:origin recognition complex subunit 2 n=1 Tax=Colletes gigas TaxID=935657 RepID=UPI001C9A9718|nr:origin recognition complex subunit 2 [Colletes gigas]